MHLTATEPLKFQPGFLVFYIFCCILYIVVFIFSYAFYKNASMKVYNKLKVKMTTYLLVGFVILLFLLIALIVTILHYGSSNDLFDNNLYMISLSWILTTLGIIHLLLLIFIPKIANKNKKQIQNFRQEDFKSLLHDLESHKPDEAYIARFKVRSARYLSNLDQHFKIIILSIENYDQKSYEQTLLNILVFNDNYTTKWTSRANYFQLKMFYEMCAVFQKKQK